MKTLFTFLIVLTLTVLLRPAFAQETNTAATNIRNAIKKIEQPPLPEMVRPARREGQSTNALVVAAPRTNFPIKVVTRIPSHLIMMRPQILAECDDLIAKYPNEEQFKNRKADMIRKIDEALVEGVRMNLTNDYLRKQYRQAVAFWTTNHIENSRIVPGAPPTNQVYFCPEVLTNSTPTQ